MQASGWTYERRIPAALDGLRAARESYVRSPNSEREVAVIRAEARLNELLEMLYEMKAIDQASMS